MQVKEIPINKINVLKNIRTRINESDLSELMESIKQHELLQPIGVYKEKDEYILSWGHRRLEACRKLGWTTIPSVISETPLNEDEFLVKNTTENIHRKNISPIELGAICFHLKELGLSIGEIAARLSMGKSKITTAINNYIKVPEEYKKYITYSSGSRNRAGNIPATVSNIIMGIKNLSQEDYKILFDYAKKDELGYRDISLIKIFINNGANVKQAVLNIRQYYKTEMSFAVRKDRKHELDKYGESNTTVFARIINGELPPIKSLVFVEEKKKINKNW